MRMNQRNKERVEPSQNFAGHSMYCAKCRAWRVKSLQMVGNGTPELQKQCRICKTVTKFEFVAGGWIPESVVRTLEDFTGAMIEKRFLGPRIKPAEKVTEELSLAKQVSKPHMTCKRFLLAVVIPIATPLTIMGALGVLAYQGIYVQPIYDLIAPLWQPWMDSIYFTIGPLVGTVALLAGYVRCRLANRVRADDEPSMIHIEDEHDVLREMEDF